MNEPMNLIFYLKLCLGNWLFMILFVKSQFLQIICGWGCKVPDEIAIKHQFIFQVKASLWAYCLCWLMYKYVNML